MEQTIELDPMEQLKHIFSRFDMDSDGSLTLLELTALLRALGLKPSEDQLHIMRATMDSNGNGTIEFDEFFKAIRPDLNKEVMASQGQLLEVFAIFDRDGNGVITTAELAGAMAKMRSPLTYRELMEMMKEADLNEDGVINFHEFTTIMAMSAAHFLGINLPAQK